MGSRCQWIAVSINCEGRFFRTVRSGGTISRRSGSAIMVFLEITSCNHRILRAAANCGLLGRYSRTTWGPRYFSDTLIASSVSNFPSLSLAVPGRGYKIAIRWQLSYYAVTEIAENILNLNVKRNTAVCTSERAPNAKTSLLALCLPLLQKYFLLDETIDYYIEYYILAQ